MAENEKGTSDLAKEIQFIINEHDLHTTDKTIALELVLGGLYAKIACEQGQDGLQLAFGSMALELPCRIFQKLKENGWEL